jgi:phosphoribosylanthranilate isomerase
MSGSRSNSACLQVKICGIRTVDVALAAAASGADLLGFNFAAVSRRRVEVVAAQEAIDAVRRREAGNPGAPPPSAIPQMVGIFVNQPVEEVGRIARDTTLDYVQLSGDEDVPYCRRVFEAFGRPVIKAIRLAEPDGLQHLTCYAHEPAVHFLLADAAGSWGGAGQAWDWSLAAGLAAKYPVLLAGGLTPANVAQAIAAVRPHGVDVASGVETAGHTDIAKVRAFIELAKKESLS